MREAISDGGQVVVLVANLTKNNILERKQGLEERLAEPASSEDEASPAYEIVEVLSDMGDPSRCREQLAEALDEHPDMDCVVGLNSYHGGPIVETLKQRDLLGKIKVVAFDTVEETLAGVEQGHIIATIAQDPYQYGYQAVRQLLHNHELSGHQLPLIGLRSTVNIDTQPLYAADVDRFRKQCKERLGGSAAPTDGAIAQ